MKRWWQAHRDLLSNSISNQYVSVFSLLSGKDHVTLLFCTK
ncbi:hypothetical protein HMPREF1613_00700 [Escherichia coli 908616]|nr:hypothetical protein HMPREF9552_03714 [Escherichia coli MS 198-1]EGW73548.1 hypothetical protein ECSTECC16502_0967 [Escherichia coli STEC_C165-02]ESA91574.1 hypothetical protein HMPREF1599_01695 [Escherichia coli 907713]ESD30806.1 hypothetical protein HMPREF1600_00588 [Escherichia coli 907715]ESD58586.1 hypothetical protein HMPREF1605_00698 [Escherichia coli 908521]ESD60818.1 hypothetical protein HMPREF1606_01008 [Escherichia coli 908522]ESD95101.1 hypothetical protein HMPREF1613_00700 [Es